MVAKAVGKTGTLLVRANFGGFRIQDVIGGGFSIADVATLIISVRDSQNTELATATLSGAEVDDQITFANLPVGTITVLCQAKNADGTVISVDGQSMASVIVTENGVNSVTLSVQLGDLTQVGQNVTFNGITVVPGNLLTSGSVTIATASPTPAPEPTPTPDATSSSEPTPPPDPTPTPAPTPTPPPVLTDTDRLVMAAGYEPSFTLSAGTYVLKIENISTVEASVSATWTLYAADGTTPLGAFSGNYNPLRSVFIDTTGTGNVGNLMFTAADVATDSVVPAQDTLTVTQ